MKKDEIKIMEDYHKAMIEEETKQAKKDYLVFEEAKKYLSNEDIEFLEYQWEDISGFGFSIIDKPKGNKQDEGEGFFVWVNQTNNGGYSGDDFSGDCSFKLKNGKYLNWYYQC